MVLQQAWRRDRGKREERISLRGVRGERLLWVERAWLKSVDRRHALRRSSRLSSRELDRRSEKRMVAKGCAWGTRRIGSRLRACVWWLMSWPPGTVGFAMPPGGRGPLFMADAPAYPERSRSAWPMSDWLVRLFSRRRRPAE